MNPTDETAGFPRMLGIRDVAPRSEEVRDPPPVSEWPCDSLSIPNQRKEEKTCRTEAKINFKRAATRF